MTSNSNGHGDVIVCDAEPSGVLRDKTPRVTLVVAGKDTTQGQRIAALVKAHKLKRYEVAELADIPRSTFCHICNDATPLTDDRAERLADLFGVTVDFIRHGTDSPPAQHSPSLNGNGYVKVQQVFPPVPPPVTPSMGWRGMEVARLVDQCTPKMQRAILAAVRAMVDSVHEDGE